MNHEENHAGYDLTESDVALFVFAVSFIQQRDSVRIVEHCLSGFKIDAVFGEILTVLSFVELESHAGLPTAVRLALVHTNVNT
jgi:hypothetical protein